MNFVTAAFYHFVDFPDYHDAKDLIKNFCIEQGLKGTILLSVEGVNATVSGSKEGIDALYKFLTSEPRFSPIESWKETLSDFMPFGKMKVRLKKELVALGVDGIDMSSRGEYVDPSDWDKFISSDDVFLIDTRNDYEINYGTFEGAIDPKTRTFREFPNWIEGWSSKLDKEKAKIAMVCTGGIRCEKSTAYVKNILGFKNVYHLKGGILGYIEKLKTDAKTWNGSCFVFDERVALTNKLNPIENAECSLCNKVVERDLIESAVKGSVFCLDCAQEQKIMSAECVVLGS